MSAQGTEQKAKAAGLRSHLDNYRLYRSEAVKAYAQRRVGEPWVLRQPWEGRMILSMTLLFLLAFSALLFAWH